MNLAGSWPVNPELPNTVPRVFIRDGMSAKDVQVIGQVQGATVDWSLVAESLGQPQSASLLHEVACLTFIYLLFICFSTLHIVGSLLFKLPSII